MLATVFMVALTAMAFPSPEPAQAANVTEDELKLAVVYRLAKFVTWPAPEAHEEADTHFDLCIDQRDIFEAARERLSGRSVRERPLRITLVDVDTSAPHCDLLYISEARASRYRELLATLDDAPVLTVGDSSEFNNNGGIVQLLTRDKRIRMQINIDAARRAGLDISSQLLSLAELVDDRGRRL